MSHWAYGYTIYSASHKPVRSVDAIRWLCYSALHKFRPIGKRDPTAASDIAGLRTEMPLKLSRHAFQLRPVSVYIIKMRSL